MWWHIGELRPTYVCFLAHAALPEDSANFPLWREIAADMLPEMSEARRATLVRAGKGCRAGWLPEGNRGAGRARRARCGVCRQQAAGST